MSDRPYAPSWLDRLTDAVGRLPGPYGIWYLAIGLVFALVRTIIGWTDGSYPVGTFFRVHVIDGLIPVYFLFVIHLLDEMAGRALTDYRSKLRGGDDDFETLRYQLTTLPWRTSLVVGILGLVAGAVYIPILLSPEDVEASHYLTAASAGVDTVLSGLSGLMMVMFGYHTIHQLRMISRIYTRHTEVSIFDTSPLYALSRVTAVTSISLLFFTYVYLAFYGDWQINSPSNAILLGAILVTALLTFVLPLSGAHRLLVAAKRDRLSVVSRRLETATDALHAKTDAGQFTTAIAPITDAIDGLLKEREVVAKTKTWPWDPDAVRAVATAVILPILIWIATRVLERFGV
ncbi:MAG: hypothetical protein ABI566_10205 [Pseudolysinimonas sp.]